MILMRALLYNLGFWALTLVVGVLGAPSLLLGRRAVLAVSEFWTRSTVAWLGVTVGLFHDIRGRENLPQGPAIVAFNAGNLVPVAQTYRALDTDRIIYIAGR